MKHFETEAIHAGREIDPATGAVVPPVHMTTTFERDVDGTYSRGHLYTRHGNPNRGALERCLAALEGGTEALCFASGSAAANALFQVLRPGDRVVMPDALYHGTAFLLRDVFSAWGLAVESVDTRDLAAVERALDGARALFVETPSNPLLSITDIAAVSSLARAARALVVVDNTWATPALQRPFELGADVVLHSTSKYLGGHCDLLGGALVLNGQIDLGESLRRTQLLAGAVPSPFDCWLTLRSIATLPVRMERHCQNAAAVADFLGAHPSVERVYYPGSPTHPDHALAARQMSGFGGMLSVAVRGDRDAAMNVAARCTLFTRATSLGGVESLIEHRASIEGPESTTPDNVLRLSVGLEHADDLIADLERALG